MTLQPSGSLSFSQIAAEFGGSTPHSISEYYKSGANVPAVYYELLTPPTCQVQ